MKLESLAVREERLQLLLRNVELAQAKIDRAQVDLNAAVIRAPVRGWIGTRVAGPGTSVRIGDPIVSVWEEGDLWVEAWVPESRLSQVNVGHHVDVRLTAHPSLALDGTVKAIGVLSKHEIDAQSQHLAGGLNTRDGDANKISLRIALTEANVRLMPGLTAVVGIKDASTTESQLSGFRTLTDVFASVAF
jgi:multidrug resistance efflux pump